jgi:single-strand DNA-binding protein
MDLNKVMLIGRVSNDLELRQTASGQNVVSFGFATGRKWKDAMTGEMKEQTEFHNVVAWGKLAETINSYAKKGKQMYIEGRLQTRSWEDKENGQKRYKTEIVADNIILLGSAGDGGGKRSEEGSSAANDEDAPKAVSSDEIRIEDVPF